MFVRSFMEGAHTDFGFRKICESILGEYREHVSNRAVSMINI